MDDGLDEERIKSLCISEVDNHNHQLWKLSLKIHSNPELAFKEHKAASWLTEYLKNNNFNIVQGFCGLPTAFQASYGKGKPVIGILAEYDALPKYGHACGHNIIAASAIGSGVASKLAIDRYGGRIIVIGTPGEESKGGKIIMAKNGAFNDLDVVMMVHPAVLNNATTSFLARDLLEIEFFGKSADTATQPEAGVNALDAMILAFAGINSLRQHIKDKARIHGIITSGGESPNVIPDYSAGIFYVRAEEENYLSELKGKVLNCFIGAAKSSGVKLKYRWGNHYASLHSNLTLAEVFRKNMQSLGRKVYLLDPSGPMGSSDIGNVSQLAPTIHATVAIAPSEIPLHSPQFAEYSASESGFNGLIDATKSLTMTVVDLVAKPEIVKRIKDEFNDTKR